MIPWTHGVLWTHGMLWTHGILTLETRCGKYATHQLISRGYAVAQLVEALCYKPKCPGFDSQLCH
jgi:hypothetical protein